MRNENGTPRRRRHSVALLAPALLGCACGHSSLEPPPCCPPVRGVVLVDWTRDGYGSPAAIAAVGELAETGANLMSVVVTGYQPDPRASTLRLQDPRTPRPAAVRRIVEIARGYALESALVPQVDLDDGSWRGTIASADPTTWFESYRTFLLPWASLAESLGATMFVVGTELAGTIGCEREWRDTIAQVRGRFSGTLTYAASWDEVDRVPFWDALDRVGVDAYFPVAHRRDPGRLEILAGWQPWILRLQSLQHRVGRPLLFTEIGYRSVDGAGMHPFATGSSGTVDAREQADLYWGALQAIAPHGWIDGLCWWNWPANPATDTVGIDYTPRGKPAEGVLREAWSAR